MEEIRFLNPSKTIEFSNWNGSILDFKLIDIFRKPNLNRNKTLKYLRCKRTTKQK